MALEINYMEQSLELLMYQLEESIEDEYMTLME